MNNSKKDKLKEWLSSMKDPVPDLAADFKPTQTIEDGDICKAAQELLQAVKEQLATDTGIEANVDHVIGRMGIAPFFDLDTQARLELFRPPGVGGEVLNVRYYYRDLIHTQPIRDTLSRCQVFGQIRLKQLIIEFFHWYIKEY